MCIRDRDEVDAYIAPGEVLRSTIIPRVASVVDTVQVTPTLIEAHRVREAAGVVGGEGCDGVAGVIIGEHYGPVCEGDAVAAYSDPARRSTGIPCVASVGDTVAVTPTLTEAAYRVREAAGVVGGEGCYGVAGVRIGEHDGPACEGDAVYVGEGAKEGEGCFLYTSDAADE